MKGRASPSQPFLDQGHGWWACTPRVEAVSARRRLKPHTKRTVRMSATTMHAFPARPHMWLQAGG
eukprot:5831081-Prymnesium_polylepis.1